MMDWRNFLLIMVVCMVVATASESAPLNLLDEGGRGRWRLVPGAEFTESGLRVMTVAAKSVTARREFSPEVYAGRLARFYGEVATDNLRPAENAGKYAGGKLLFHFVCPDGSQWGGEPVAEGTAAPRKFSRIIRFPQDMKKAILSVGLQDAAGTLHLREAYLENLGSAVDMSSVNNMALADTIPGDGKGGWSDQGEDMDGRNFDFYDQKLPVPFALIPKGKSVLTMKSVHFPAGPTEVTVPVRPARQQRFLYILHTACWCGAEGETFGKITVIGESGKEQLIPVVCGREGKDWVNPDDALSNGAVVMRTVTRAGSVVGMYVSRFPLNADLGKITAVRLTSTDSEPLWIIAGVTLSERDWPLPDPLERKVTMAANAEWGVVDRAPQALRAAGTVLDLSGFRPAEPAGTHGRVIINPQGHFAFADAPEKPLRFLCAAWAPIGDTHADVDAYIAQLRRCGYNMVRTHFLDNQVMRGMKKSLEFNPRELDIYYYTIAKMKENGIYWNFDCMTSWLGYNPGNCWFAKDRNGMKAEIYFDPEARKNWLEGVKLLLCTENPYTHTKMIDDPVLVMTVAFNEQEFAFIRPNAGKLFAPSWRRFLEKRYGTIDKWKTAHPDKVVGVRTFADVPEFRANDFHDNEVAAFITEQENSLFAWYRESLRQIGYKGYLTNYNMCKDQRYSYLHNQMDFVAMNSYHAHPNGKRIAQNSSLGNSAGSFRYFAGMRIAGKPFVVTEHNHVFWNRYRYEQGLLIGGYGAFSDYDVLTVHGSPVGPSNRAMVQSFNICNDPVHVASEFLTWCAFVRGDVRPAEKQIRVVVDPTELPASATARNAIAGAQTKLGLLGSFALEYAADEKELPPAGRNVLRLPRQGSAKVINNTAGFASAVETADNLEKQVAALKKSGFLKVGNRSDGRGMFETETGEIFLDANHNFLSVNTPRLQGICGEAGATARLADFEVLSLGERGCLAVAAMDGMKPLAEAERMVLVYSTNALNSGDEFASPEMVVRLKQGKGETLLRRGRFSVALRNRFAAELKGYVLRMDGTRKAPLQPEKSVDGKVFFTVDTAQAGGNVFFEICR